MTVPKSTVRTYLDQLDRMDHWDKQRTRAYVDGDFALYEELGTIIHGESQKLQELRVILTDAVES